MKRPPPPSPVTLPRQENTEIVEEAHCEAWRAYINANASPVSDHFAGLLRSTVECCSCHCKSVRYDPYLDLSLPLPPPPSNVRSPLSAKLQKGSTSCTLEECLQRFTAVEDLTEKITCERCKKPRKSKKSLTLQTWHRPVRKSNFRLSVTASARWRGGSTPSARRSPRNCICSMGRRFHAIDAKLPLFLRLLDGVR